MAIPDTRGWDRLSTAERAARTAAARQAAASKRATAYRVLDALTAAGIKVEVEPGPSEVPS